MIRSSDPKFALRHDLVTYAIKNGIKAAARCYKSSRNTVRKWLRRFIEHKNQGLLPLSRAPRFCPYKTSPALEAKFIAQRKKTPGFGARRLIAEFDLPVGHNAGQRILREHHLTPQRKRPISTNVLSGGTTYFKDPSWGTRSHRVYRLLAKTE